VFYSIISPVSLAWIGILCAGGTAILSFLRGQRWLAISGIGLMLAEAILLYPITQLDQRIASGGSLVEITNVVVVLTSIALLVNELYKGRT